jgi:branched-chain amino acid aminotransferase
MKTYYNHNGKLFEVADPSVLISDHSYRYGDGLFETMKLIKGKVPLLDLHIERLFYSMQVLGFRVPVLFSKKNIEEEIIKVAEKNNCLLLGRVRLTVSRGNGGVNDCDDKLQYTIECRAAEESINHLNENGFFIDAFPDAIKSCDKFSNLKSASYMHYIMGAKYAKENKLNDALILNQHGRICEATIANIFWIKDDRIHTPPLSEGCVAGVMRKYLLEKIPAINRKTSETELTIDELQNAEEVFLTNAVYGMRWVRGFRDKQYQNIQCIKLFQSVLSPLWK